MTFTLKLSHLAYRQPSGPFADVQNAIHALRFSPETEIIFVLL